MAPSLSVRELEEADIPLLCRYWFESDSAFLVGMGVDLQKMPTRESWTAMLMDQIRSDYADKKSYCVIWLVDGKPSGHCNINAVVPGEEAAMHLHLWTTVHRGKGYGHQFVKMSLPFFFKNYNIKKLYSEPYALNPAPNKTLPKAGFRLVKEYITTPGWINFEQPVKRWEITREEFDIFNIHL